MRRFFYDSDIQDTEDRVLINGAEAHHIRSVLRMQCGDAVELFDGTGSVVAGRIEQICSGQVVFQVMTRHMEPETGIPLTLAQGVLKGKKMDLLIQKATELGVNAFVPVITRYCAGKTGERQQLKRWTRIMLEACKQCRRPVPMHISPPTPLQDLFFPEGCNKVMPWEGEQNCSFSAVRLDCGRPVVLLIGPEGGFHADEVEYALELGFMTFSLGPRILRAETAALSAVTLIQHTVHNLCAFPGQPAAKNSTVNNTESGR
ncbi:MAG: RsmE family RNA methyltransferase [Candidatus Electrothrix sp. YB6]